MKPAVESDLDGGHAEPHKQALFSSNLGHPRHSFFEEKHFQMSVMQLAPERESNNKANMTQAGQRRCFPLRLVGRQQLGGGFQLGSSEQEHVLTPGVNPRQRYLPHLWRDRNDVRGPPVALLRLRRHCEKMVRWIPLKVSRLVVFCPLFFCFCFLLNFYLYFFASVLLCHPAYTGTVLSSLFLFLSPDGVSDVTVPPPPRRLVHSSSGDLLVTLASNTNKKHREKTHKKMTWFPRNELHNANAAVHCSWKLQGALQSQSLSNAAVQIFATRCHKRLMDGFNTNFCRKPPANFKMTSHFLPPLHYEDRLCPNNNYSLPKPLQVFRLSIRDIVRK